MNTMNDIPANISPDWAERLWYDGIAGTYCDEVDDKAECENCGGSFDQHHPEDDDYECDSYWGCSVAYLDPEARKDGALEAKLIAAYEASKSIPYADMQAYDESDQWNPWNVMNDCLIAGDFADCVDTEAFDKAYAWVEGWKEYTEANGWKDYIEAN